MLRSRFLVAGLSNRGLQLNLLGELRPDLSDLTVQEYLAKPPSRKYRQVFNLLKMIMVCIVCDWILLDLVNSNAQHLIFFHILIHIIIKILHKCIIHKMCWSAYHTFFFCLRCIQQQTSENYKIRLLFILFLLKIW